MTPKMPPKGNTNQKTVKPTEIHTAFVHIPEENSLAIIAVHGTSTTMKMVASNYINKTPLAYDIKSTYAMDAINITDNVSEFETKVKNSVMSCIERAMLYLAQNFPKTQASVLPLDMTPFIQMESSMKQVNARLTEIGTHIEDNLIERVFALYEVNLGKTGANFPSWIENRTALAEPYRKALLSKPSIVGVHFSGDQSVIDVAIPKFRQRNFLGDYSIFAPIAQADYEANNLESPRFAVKGSGLNDTIKETRQTWVTKLNRTKKNREKEALACESEMDKKPSAAEFDNMAGTAVGVAAPSGTITRSQSSAIASLKRTETSSYSDDKQAHKKVKANDSSTLIESAVPPDERTPPVIMTEFVNNLTLGANASSKKNEPPTSSTAPKKKSSAFSCFGLFGRPERIIGHSSTASKKTKTTEDSSDSGKRKGWFKKPTIFPDAQAAPTSNSAAGQPKGYAAPPTPSRTKNP